MLAEVSSPRAGDRGRHEERRRGGTVMLEVIGRRSDWLCDVLRKVLAWGIGWRWTGSSELRGTEGSSGGKLWRWCLCALVRMRWRGAKWNEEGLKEQRGASRECLSYYSVE